MHAALHAALMIRQTFICCKVRAQNRFLQLRHEQPKQHVSLVNTKACAVQECEAVLEVLQQQEQDQLARVPASQRHKIKQGQVSGSNTPDQEFPGLAVKRLFING